MWAPATFHVGHVSATWGIAEGEAVASQDHLAQVLGIHKDILSCHISMNVLILVEELQGVQLGKKENSMTNTKRF